MQNTQDIGDLTNARVVASLKDNLTLIKKTMRMPRNKDCVVREFAIGETRAALVFIDGLASRSVLELHVLTPCMQWGERAHEMPKDLLTFLAEHVISVFDVKPSEQIDECIQGMLNTKVLLLVDGCDSVLMMEARGLQRRGVEKPVNESVVLGPQEGFVEGIRTNLSLVRANMRSPRLVTEMVMLGREIPTQCAVMYLDGVAEDATVQEVLRRIRNVARDYVPGTGHLEQMIEDHPFAFYPQVCSTERPDRASSFLLEGQVLVFVDGSPQVMAMPISAPHLFHTPDDTYMRWQYGTFLRLVRATGMYSGIFFPGLYVALAVHHPQAIPSVLLSSLYEAQARLPLPMVIEALIMVIAFHLINEAGTRMPGSMGSALGVVSALILGQAAVSADLVSPIMIIVIAVSGLGIFVVPDYNLSVSIKIRQVLYIVVANFFGLYGMALLFLLLQTNVSTLSSFGSPLFAPFTPPRPHNPDIYLRMPLWMQRTRGFLVQPSNALRQLSRARGWSGNKEKDK